MISVIVQQIKFYSHLKSQCILYIRPIFHENIYHDLTIKNSFEDNSFPNDHPRLFILWENNIFSVENVILSTRFEHFNEKF